MTYNHTVVIIIPDAQRSAFQALGEAMGFDAGFTGSGVRLSADGAEPVTHWGLHTWAQDSFAALFSTPSAIIAASIPGQPYTAEQLDALRSVFIYSIDPEGGETNRAHFDLVLAANGLTEIQADI